jgi:type IV pilus assembly protein PilQ
MVQLAVIVATFWVGCANAESAGGETENSILSLSAAPSTAGKLVLKVSLKNPLVNQPAAFTINMPPRIAFDFPNTGNGLGKSTQEFGEGDLRGVNVVQAGSRTRLVVNLNQMLSYDTQIEGNDLLITLQGKAAAASVEPVSTSRFAEAKPGAMQEHSLRDVDFRRGKNGEGRVQIDLSDTNVGIDIKQQGKTLVVEFAKTSLPGNLQRKLDVVDFGTPVQLIDAFAQGENTRLVIEPKGMWEYAAYQTDNKFIIEVKTVVEDTAKLTKASRAAYAGEKLSLNFQNISTREALNVIADFTDLNMVISDTVSGNLTLRLKDVPWDQALQIILDTRGLLQQREGNVIMVAPREEIAARQKDSLTTQKVISQLEPMQTESFPLNYARVEDVKAVLAGSQKANVSTNIEDGKSSTTIDNSNSDAIALDSRTNTLYITATLSRLAQIREIIKKLDVPVRQVLIEARFVEATSSFNRTLGGRLGFAGKVPVVGTGTPIGGNSGYAGQLTSANVNLPNSSSGLGGLSLSLFDAAATNTLTLELTASEIDGNTKSIASPRVMTGDSMAATIKSGVQIPYSVAGSATSGPSVAFKDATLSLVVTPKITPDDRVTMKLDVKQDTVGNVYGGIPSINNKQVTTTVLVDNGGTVVIGGVYTQDVTQSTSKVPLFGDIPILGWLFKNENKTDIKKELLIFITPKILKDGLNLN